MKAETKEYILELLSKERVKLADNWADWNAELKYLTDNNKSLYNIDTCKGTIRQIEEAIEKSNAITKEMKGL